VRQKNNTGKQYLYFEGFSSECLTPLVHVAATFIAA
jgi:hypothetical protein